MAFALAILSAWDTLPSALLVIHPQLSVLFTETFPDLHIPVGYPILVMDSVIKEGVPSA